MIILWNPRYQRLNTAVILADTFVPKNFVHIVYIQPLKLPILSSFVAWKAMYMAEKHELKKTSPKKKYE